MAIGAETRFGLVRAAERLLPAALALALWAAAAALAARFRDTAVREFRFDWGTWCAALLLAFASGVLLSRAFSARGSRAARVAAGVALVASVALLLHLPLVLLGSVHGWGGRGPLSTAPIVDRSGPQLLAAAVAGAASSRARRARSARTRSASSGSEARFASSKGSARRS
jgi:hypothetical protein